MRRKILMKSLISEREAYINSRIEDRIYADSWEQSAQITADIEKLKKEIKAIKDYISTGNLSVIKEILRAEIFHRTIEFRSRSLFY